ncbi:TPA_asm: hypothetical protein GYO74_14095 [Listeria monocytogenes]|uniref:hypothetical protein n=1 Tax=Listeria monocytogenes TaxID=1639 RepID=UPI0004D57FBA|nr:hypothetical protein [Listeria monocytogenes]APQ08121.1 hypothetical protein BTR18_06015 [Listeria monocytogenes]APV01126.1 hypothetical protein BWI18_06015 [Listeria monocytogenes]APV04098.1 hypothetical protein BWI19_06015 [Listeria monocytogenes]APV07147.1 hypothetical protein BWI20_06015 [Listeria monocytogenes]APV10246.1 hypothetical protein BWI22_06015 [Listeria monocytogenes]
MTNHNVLYTQAQTKLAARPIGRFRLSDLVDNPPANLGKKFRNDVVVNKRYSNVKRVGADGQSVIYEKF